MLSCIVALALLLAIEPSALADASAKTEKEKIESLLKHVEGMKDATFVRNGVSYDAKSAATFLRRKWEANTAEIKTAKDFIDKVASQSSTSGKPYLIRFKAGEEVKSRDHLLAELKKLDSPKPDPQTP